MISDDRIDHGKSFDWGRTSADYAKYRDIYPQEFYQKIHALGLCTKDQAVLDLGTGTGVIPRNMHRYGAHFVGTDISDNQIQQAKLLANSANMNIEFLTCSTEQLEFPPSSFDVITACQCFFYFNHEVLAPKAHKILKDHGKLAVMYMAWLPFEDEIARASEELVLKYNSEWSGKEETRHEIHIPGDYNEFFSLKYSTIFDVKIPFDRAGWNGRIKACRGIGASLSQAEIEQFDWEHQKLLKDHFNEQFDILHYCAISILQKK